MTLSCDVAVVGAGPGGYVAALRGAQLGAKVLLVEKEDVGGVCLNHGCIPTKALLRTAEILTLSRQAPTFGVILGKPQLDWAAAQKRKARVVRRLTGGVKFLLKKAGVESLQGTARFTSPTVLEVATEDGTERIEARSYVIATGSRSVSLPIPGLEGPGVITSREALALETLPDSMLIVGGGAIGVEFATLFGICGVQTTIIELLPRLLPLLDSDLGAEVEQSLKKAKINVQTASSVSRVDRREGLLAVTVVSDSQETVFKVDTVLVAVGRRPNVEDVGLDLAGVLVERTGIVTDDRMRTNLSNVYAVGDVTGGALLAHVAMKEGVVAVENALGQSSVMNYTAVPACVFTQPEVASVGLSEEQAKQQGHDVRVGKFPFRANGKALAQGETEGLVKIVADGEYGQLLGVHIVGPHASDLIQEGTLGLTLESTWDEIQATIHPHPTLSEAFAEAALAVQGHALHM